MLLNNPLGASAPFGLNKKSNAFLGAAGLVGAIMDWDAQTSANAINRQNTIDVNRTNKEINDSQLAWAREQYNQEVAENRFLVDQAYQRELENRSHNEFYNSPAEVARRLRAAGINPYLAMAGGAGSIGSSRSSSINAQVGQNPHANQPNMIPMDTGAPAQAFTGFGVGFQNMAQIHLAAEKNAADISALKQETNNHTLETLAKIANYNWNNKYLKAQMDSVLDDIKFNRENWDVRSSALDLANKKISSDINYQESLAVYQNILNDFAPKIQAQSLDNLKAQYSELMSAVYSNNATAAYNIAMKALVNAQEKGQHVSNDILEKKADAIIDEAYSNADRAYFNAGSEKNRYYYGETGYRVGRGFSDDVPDNVPYDSPRYGKMNGRRFSSTRRKDLDHVGM